MKKRTLQTDIKKENEKKAKKKNNNIEKRLTGFEPPTDQTEIVTLSTAPRGIRRLLTVEEVIFSLYGFFRIRPGSRSSRSPGITVLFHRNMLKHKNKGRLRNFLVLHLEIHNRTNLSSTRRSSPAALSQGVPKRTKRVHL